MHNRLPPFLSALLISVSAALADPQSNTNGFSSSASSLIQKISLNIEALQPRFTELADFSAATNSVTRIDYRRNVDYVAKIPKCNSYYHVKPGGCLIVVEAWDASSGGWPGMRAGPEIESINHTFTNGVQIMANIESPNKELRKSVRAAIDVHLRSAK